MLDTLANGLEELGLSLTAAQAEQFHIYLEELLDWNRRMNLTSINDREQVQTKHFLDSLTLVPLVQRVWPVGRAPDILDVGTGAGFPGLPVKIMLPAVRLALLESVAKKTAFLQHLAGRLGLKDVTVVNGRAEEAAHRGEFRESFDIVVSRGLAKLPAAVELTLPFCRVGGLAVAQKKGDIKAEIDAAARAIDLLGGKLASVKEVPLRPLDTRLLVVVEKVAPTPSRYPRRPGLPAKRPL